MVQIQNMPRLRVCVCVALLVLSLTHVCFSLFFYASLFSFPLSFFCHLSSDPLPFCFVTPLPLPSFLLFSLFLLLCLFHFFASPLCFSFTLLPRCDMGESGVTLCSSGGSGGRLRPAWPPRHCAHHCGLHGRVCPQEPGLLAEEKGRLGKVT